MNYIVEMLEMALLVERRPENCLSPSLS